MANRHKSALKANRQTIKRQAHNRSLRSELRTAIKTIRTTIDAGDLEKAKSLESQTYSIIDKMSAKGIIHDNAAARHKSRIVKKIRATPAAG